MQTFRIERARAWSIRLSLASPGKALRVCHASSRRHHHFAVARNPILSCSSPASALKQALDSGKVNKTMLSKLPVADLRAECHSVGLPSEGTKPVLVERLLQWAREQLAPSTGSGSGRPSQPPGLPRPAGQPGTPDGGLGQQLLSTASPGSSQGGFRVAAAVAADGLADTRPSAPPSSTASPPSPPTPRPAAPSKSIPSADAGAIAARVQPHQQRPTSPGAATDAVTVTFLGTSSGNPTARRNVSCFAVRFGEQLCLVDAGEGSRNQLRRAGVDIARVSHLFITHLHGDHCFGVCGVLAEICQARLGTPLQHQPIQVFGPPELRQLVAGTYRLAALPLTTPVVVTGWALDPGCAHPPRPLDASGMLKVALVAPDQSSSIPPDLAAQWQQEYEERNDAQSDGSMKAAAWGALWQRILHPGLTWSAEMGDGVTVTAAQLAHRVPCWGYVFREPSRLEGPVQGGAGAGGGAGTDAAAGGGAWVRRGRKVVVLGDTCDSRAIAAAARDCDFISHEATFMKGMEQKAEVATHSTSEQAGAFARSVNARNLVLTHFSARYESSRQPEAGPRRGRGGRPGAAAAAAGGEGEGEDLGEGELRRIVREAQGAFGSDRVYLASDFYTFKVFPHPPEPLPQGVHPQQWLAGAAAPAVEADWAKAAAAVERLAGPWPPPRAPRRYPPPREDNRGGGGGRHREGGHRAQRRHGGGRAGSGGVGQGWRGRRPPTRDPRDPMESEGSHRSLHRARAGQQQRQPSPQL